MPLLDASVLATFLDDAACAPDHSPATAPASLNARGIRYLPREWDSRAIPYGSDPGLTVADATTAACLAACRADVPLEFEPGTYWFSGTFAPGGRRNNTETAKTLYFNNTTFRLTAGLTTVSLTRTNTINGFTSFAEMTREGTGVASIPNVAVPGSAAATYMHLGTGSQSDNLPPRRNTWVFFDVTGSEGSFYSGNLTLHGGPSIDDLAAFGCSNEFWKNGQGGARSQYAGEWTFSNWHYGLFGTPKYSDTRTNYGNGFVGCRLPRLRFNSNVDIPILVASNQLDDSGSPEINILGSIVNGSRPNSTYTGRSYVYGTVLKTDAVYSNQSTAGYIFDLQKCSLIVNGTFYFENTPGNSNQPNAAIIARNRAQVFAELKVGSNTSPALGCMIYDVMDTASGVVRANFDTGDSNAVALIRMVSRNSSRRCWTVFLPYQETAASAPFGLPFMMEANGSQKNQNDQLISFAPKASGGASSGLEAMGVKWVQVGNEGDSGAVTAAGGATKASIAGTGGLARLVPSFT
jgi:hypothetical protein